MAGRLHQLIDRYRLSVARHDAGPQMALLGIVAGLLAGLTIILFRLLVEWLHGALTGGAEVSDFASLAPQHRLLLPIAGGLLIGVLFHFLAASERRVGILHILERLANHQGHLPWRNALVQFVEEFLLPRRWVDRRRHGSDGLPWSFFRSETVQSLNGEQRKKLVGLEYADAGN